MNDGKQPGKVNPEITEVSEQECNQIGDGEMTVNECAAVQTRAMAAKEKKPPKPLKVNSVPGLDIGPDELKSKQKEDVSLKKYWELVDKLVEVGKPQFFLKKGILYRKYSGRQKWTTKYS